MSLSPFASMRRFDKDKSVRLSSNLRRLMCPLSRTELVKKHRCRHTEDTSVSPKLVECGLTSKLILSQCLSVNPDIRFASMTMQRFPWL